jgi:hypothetical protein
MFNSKERKGSVGIQGASLPSQTDPAHILQRRSNSIAGPRPMNTTGPTSSIFQYLSGGSSRIGLGPSTHPSPQSKEQEAVVSHVPPMAANDMGGQNPQDEGKDILPTQTYPGNGREDHANVPSEVVKGLQEALENAQNELQYSNAQLREIRKKWKQAAVELNELRSQGQGFYQVTDEFLIGLAKQLRFSIRSFAIQYFGRLVSNDMLKKRCWEKHMVTSLIPNTCDYYLKSDKKRPSIIQAYVWRMFVSKIFDAFRWAGPSGKDLWMLCGFLRPSKCATGCVSTIADIGTAL